MKKTLVIILLTLLILPIGITSLADSNNKLSIETTKAYADMEKSYSNGYVPTVKNGKATIVLPLVGETTGNTITVTPEIGTESPFMYANYRFDVKKSNGVYLVKLVLPLKSDRQNGLYPVVFNVEYITNEVAQTQTFTVFVSITDANPIRTPELFISEYKNEPEIVNGGDEFSSIITIKNIGGQMAENVKLTYSGMEDDPSIVPSKSLNTIIIDNINEGKSKQIDLKFNVSPDALAGNQSYTITLEYSDAQGNLYTLTKVLTIKVNQPTEISIDEIMFPASAESGESVVLPISILNTGKSPIYRITCRLNVDGLFGSSLFIGEVPAGETGYGEMKVFIGTLSGNNLYGAATGALTISYFDITGAEHTETVDLYTDILEPAAESGEEQPSEQEVAAPPISQWYVSVIVGIAVIAIAVAVIVVTSYQRRLKMVMYGSGKREE